MKRGLRRFHPLMAHYYGLIHGFIRVSTESDPSLISSHTCVYYKIYIYMGIIYKRRDMMMPYRIKLGELAFMYYILCHGFTYAT